MRPSDHEKVELRAAMPEDRDLAFRIREAAFRSYLEKIHPWDEDEQLLLHAQRFKTQDFRMIRLTGIDVGFLSLNHNLTEIKLHQFFILPEYQKRGLGEKCMVTVMEEARQKGLPVTLKVMKVNPMALAFYLRLGFILIGETQTHDLLKLTSGLEPSK